MSKFEKMLSETEIDATSIKSSSEPWKERIVSYLIDREDPLATYEEILEATDDKYNGDNFNKRKHCLDSQFTYIRQDLNILTKKVDDKIAVLGIVKEDKLRVFTNAVNLV